MSITPEALRIAGVAARRARSVAAHRFVPAGARAHGVVAPRVLAAVRAPRRVLPLGLGRQALARPGAVRRGHRPGHAIDRVVLLVRARRGRRDRVRVAPLVKGVGRRAGARSHASPVVRDRHFRSVDVERLYGHLVDGPLVGLSVVRPERNLGRGQVHHLAAPRHRGPGTRMPQGDVRAAGGRGEGNPTEDGDACCGRPRPRDGRSRLYVTHLEDCAGPVRGGITGNSARCTRRPLPNRRLTDRACATSSARRGRALFQGRCE